MAKVKQIRFIPLGNRVVVRLDRADLKSSGGLYIPQTASRANAGTVVAVGPGAPGGRDGKLARPPVKVGQRVRFMHMTDELEPGLVVVESAAIVGVWQEA